MRVLDSGGTASTVRVTIESTDGDHIWSTVGVSSNIIQACFKALVDSVDYMLTYYALRKKLVINFKKNKMVLLQNQWNEKGRNYV